MFFFFFTNRPNFFTVLCVRISVTCYHVTTKVGIANIAIWASTCKVGSADVTDMAGNSKFTWVTSKYTSTTFSNPAAKGPTEMYDLPQDNEKGKTETRKITSPNVCDEGVLLHSCTYTAHFPSFGFSCFSASHAFPSFQLEGSQSLTNRTDQHVWLTWPVWPIRLLHLV